MSGLNIGHAMEGSVFTAIVILYEDAVLSAAICCEGNVESSSTSQTAMQVNHVPFSRRASCEEELTGAWKFFLAWSTKYFATA